MTKPANSTRFFSKVIASLKYRIAVGPFRIPGLGFPVFTRNLVFFSPTRVQARALHRSLSSEELERTNQLFSVIPHGRDVIIDVGANIGYSTAQYRLACSRGQSRPLSFLLVEPNLQNLRFLTHNLNQVFGAEGRSQWDLLPVALTGATGFLPAGIPEAYSTRPGDGPKNTGLLTFASGREMIPESAQSFPVVHAAILSEFVNYEEVGLCKIDIEGGEIEFLEAVGDCFFQSDIIVEIEVNPLYMTNVETQALVEILRQHRYTMLAPESFEWGNRADVLLVPAKLASKIAGATNLIGFPLTKITN